MSSLFGLVRLNIQIPDAGIMRVVGGAIVTVYNTNSNGTSPVTREGAVSLSAVKSTLYKNRDDLTTLANPLISDAQGLVEFFAPIGNYHFSIVTPDGKQFGVPWYGHPGDVTKIQYGSNGVIPEDGLDLQDVLDSIPKGGKLVLGPGRFVYPDGGLVIKKNVEICGNGAGGDTTLIPSPTGGTSPAIRTASGTEDGVNYELVANKLYSIYIHDLIIDGGKVNPTGSTAATVVGANGIHIVASANQLLGNVMIERVQCIRMAGHGMHVASTPLDEAALSCVIGLQINACQFTQNWGKGLNIRGGVTLFSTRGNLYASNLDEGALFRAVDVDCCGDYYENNCGATDLVAGYNAQGRFYGSVFDLRKISVEEFSNMSDVSTVSGHQPGCTTGLSFIGSTGRVSGCRFLNYGENDVTNPSIGIFVDNTDKANAIKIDPCLFYLTATAILASSVDLFGNHKLSVSPQNVTGGTNYINLNRPLTWPVIASGRSIAAGINIPATTVSGTNINGSRTINMANNALGTGIEVVSIITATVEHPGGIAVDYTVQTTLNSPVLTRAIPLGSAY